MTGERERVVIVGAGLAGLRAAESLRRAGFDGTIALVGEEREPPYDRPPLSKEILLGTREPASVRLRSDEAIAALELDLRLGTAATGLDLAAREVETASGRLPFDHLVIATGSGPRALPLLEDVEGVATLRTLDDAIAIRDALATASRLVVVGAGFIGSEIASVARAQGVEVTVLELDPVPLARVLGPELGRGFAQLHRDHGTDLRLGVTIDRAEVSGGRVARLHLTDGTTIEPDLVVVGIGAVPTTSWLASSGLELAGGVVCDASLRTSHPSVFAIGDVCSWHNELFGRRMRVEHWTSASEQAAHVGRAIAGGPLEPFRGSNYVWSDQYGTRIQFVGIATDDVVIVDGVLEEHRYLAWYREGDRLVGALVLDAPRQLMRSRKAIEAGATFAEALTILEG